MSTAQLLKMYGAVSIPFRGKGGLHQALDDGDEILDW